MKHFVSVLREIKPVARDTYWLRLESDLARHPTIPGQFVHMEVPGQDLLLRRPISLYTVDRDAGAYELIVQVKGEGTRRLCSAQPGAAFDTLGTLGRGFMPPKGTQKAALVGGGIGVAPLRYCMEKWPGIAWDAYLGFRGQQYAYGLDVFEGLARHLYLASDDGTLGERGFVTDRFKEHLAEEGYDIVMACGPAPMFRALKTVMAGHPELPCQISLEQRMGCGVGACRVCVCRIRTADGVHYRRVCQDGPVFSLGEVDLS